MRDLEVYVISKWVLFGGNQIMGRSPLLYCDVRFGLDGHVAKENAEYCSF